MPGPVYPGQTRVGDKVRVKDDAYGEYVGRGHNGKIGRVVGARNGQFIVSYDDGSASSVHHQPDTLETYP